MKNAYSGYLTLNEEVYTFSADGFQVFLLPATNDLSDAFKKTRSVKEKKKNDTEFLYGICDLYNIAIKTNNHYNTDHLGMSPKISFTTPLVIMASGNGDGYYSKLTAEWNTFHAITFYGYSINPLYDPQMAFTLDADLDSYNGVTHISTLPFDAYTRRCQIALSGEIVDLTLSIGQSRRSLVVNGDKEQTLGGVYSFLRLEFRDTKGFECIENYYSTIKKLVALLTKRNNIHFDVELRQKLLDGKYGKTADCYILEKYDNYANRNLYQVVSLIDVFNLLPQMVSDIHNGKVDVLISVLPDDNRKLNYLSINDVKNICTALEVAYQWNHKGKEKDLIIEQLKREIKDTINAFLLNHRDLDVYKQTTISNDFEHLDYTLKDRIFTLLRENKSFLQGQINRCGFSDITIDMIGEFVKLRNNVTHSGAFEWPDSVEMYPVLISIVYIEWFKSLKMDEGLIRRIVSKW